MCSYLHNQYPFRKQIDYDIYNQQLVIKIINYLLITIEQDN